MDRWLQLVFLTLLGIFSSKSTSLTPREQSQLLLKHSKFNSKNNFTLPYLNTKILFTKYLTPKHPKIENNPNHPLTEKSGGSASEPQTPAQDKLFFPPYIFPFWGLPFGIYSRGGFFNPGLFPFVPGGPGFPPMDGVFGSPWGPGQFPGSGPTPYPTKTSESEQNGSGGGSSSGGSMNENYGNGKYKGKGSLKKGKTGNKKGKEEKKSKSESKGKCKCPTSQPYSDEAEKDKTTVGKLKTVQYQAGGCKHSHQNNPTTSCKHATGEKTCGCRTSQSKPCGCKTISSGKPSCTCKNKSCGCGCQNKTPDHSDNYAQTPSYVLPSPPKERDCVQKQNSNPLRYLGGGCKGSYRELRQNSVDSPTMPSGAPYSQFENYLNYYPPQSTTVVSSSSDSYRNSYPSVLPSTPNYSQNYPGAPAQIYYPNVNSQQHFHNYPVADTSNPNPISNINSENGNNIANSYSVDTALSSYPIPVSVVEETITPSYQNPPYTITNPNPNYYSIPSNNNYPIPDTNDNGGSEYTTDPQNYSPHSNINPELGHVETTSTYESNSDSAGNGEYLITPVGVAPLSTSNNDYSYTQSNRYSTDDNANGQYLFPTENNNAGRYPASSGYSIPEYQSEMYSPTISHYNPTGDAETDWNLEVPYEPAYNSASIPLQGQEYFHLQEQNNYNSPETLNTDALHPQEVKIDYGPPDPAAYYAEQDPSFVTRNQNYVPYNNRKISLYGNLRRKRSEA